VGAPWWSSSGKVESSDQGEARPALDFGDARLRALTRALAPAYLRIGGTDADRLVYDVAGGPVAAPPGTFVLSAAHWDALTAFARALGLEVLFTLNAGPAARDASGDWRPDSARALLEHARRRGDPIAAWELGNEPDIYWNAFGWSHHVSGETYARDFARLRALLSGARSAGPASAYWPLVGELIGPTALLPEFLAATETPPEIVSWHYYPQQSRRCSVAVRRVRTGRPLDPAELDEFARWSERVRSARDRHAPRAALWLGETANAQCGGEPGVSDRFVGVLWWLDQLGLAARLGNAVVVRQALVGSEYGLLDAPALAPRPDYWASLLWKRRMGERVLAVRTAGENAYLRAYAHCALEPAGAVSLLLLNVHPSRPADAVLEGVAAGSARIQRLDAPSLGADVLRLNGEPLALRDGRFPALDRFAPAPAGALRLAPASAAFVELPTPVPACG
jgi:hypothetical protein